MSLEDLTDQFNLAPKKKLLEDHDLSNLVNCLYNVSKLTDEYNSININDYHRAQSDLARAVYLIGKAIARQHGRNDVY